MTTSISQRILLNAFALIVGVALSVTFFLTAAQPVSSDTTDNLSGWAWSENIGWISFNCTNSGSCASSDYGVNVKNSGDLQGYAWSENVGWVSFEFGDIKSCPDAPPQAACKPTLNQTTGQATGWARACAGTVTGDCSGTDRIDGWDGWIHLGDQPNYGVTVAGCTWGGYAWGSDVVGWIHFSGTNYGVLGTGDACVTALNQCEDTLDNDNDGKIDFVGGPPPLNLPPDPGCESATDNNELDQCKDKEDNDGELIVM